MAEPLAYRIGGRSSLRSSRLATSNKKGISRGCISRFMGI
ncbi:hypothetical protein MJO28_015742 [Puccinia striiformis f. sp. tritici]|uniref:Uncharacterized protein n=1 Tax=Puccinia striiformis f. sp. tritici TaxID=168172 RepID=A0ACC0DPT0_9BASI|nr:hypothetical protein MJO28_015742 [Puccinia striiformis f. sp. tritici]